MSLLHEHYTEQRTDETISGANGKRDVRHIQNESKPGQTGQGNVLV